MSAITYAKAGVSIDRGNLFVKKIKPLANRTNIPGVLGGVGGFSALFRVDKRKYRDPVLVTTTDGVGTKLEIAMHVGRHDTVGIDLVAMCVNDLVTCGARPVVFLDYFATGRLELRNSEAIIRGIANGCMEAGCALVGGETAEMPGFYGNGRYDLAGFAVGIVERSRIIDGSAVRKGDAVLGLASSGFHSNGFSLIRKLYSKKELSGAVGRKFLTPTKIYVKPMLAMIEKLDVKAIAHITGGGFYDNIPRVIPNGLGVQVRADRWLIPKLFQEVMSRARVNAYEMFRTFNMGIGMAVVLPRRDVLTAQRLLKRFSIPSWQIGEVVKGKGVKIS